MNKKEVEKTAYSRQDSGITRTSDKQEIVHQDYLGI